MCCVSQSEIGLGNNGAQQPGRTSGPHQGGSTGGLEQGSRWWRGFHTMGKASQPRPTIPDTHLPSLLLPANKDRPIITQWASFYLCHTPKEKSSTHSHTNATSFTLEVVASWHFQDHLFEDLKWATLRENQVLDGNKHEGLLCLMHFL